MAVALLRAVSAVVLTVLLGGVAIATLVRFAPGFGVDERELDARLSSESLGALRRDRAGEQNVLRFYAAYLGGLLRGKLGASRTTGRPIAELLGERIPVTARTVSLGWAAGWTLGLGLALLAAAYPGSWPGPAGSALSAVLLSVPSAALALLLLVASPGRTPETAAALALSLVIFPRVFRYARAMLAEASQSPHVLMARLKGLGRMRVVLAHMLLVPAEPLLALAGVTVSVALGAAVPIEVLTDAPGIGQLAWQAAQQRDLPLLLNVSLWVTLVTVSANALAELGRGLLVTRRSSR